MANSSRFAARAASSSCSRSVSCPLRSTTCCWRVLTSRWSWSMSAGAPRPDSRQSLATQSQSRPVSEFQRRYNATLWAQAFVVDSARSCPSFNSPRNRSGTVGDLVVLADHGPIPSARRHPNQKRPHPSSVVRVHYTESQSYTPQRTAANAAGVSATRRHTTWSPAPEKVFTSLPRNSVHDRFRRCRRHS